MFFQKDLNVTSQEVNANFIDIYVNEGGENAWRFTGFYGEPSGERKHLSWDYMRSLHAKSGLPWLIAGDFNEIMFSHEKEGGNVRPQRCMQAFRDAVSDCSLQDLGFAGDPFTWRRGRIRERLDRVLATQSWIDLFPNHGVLHEDFGKSDHRPITVDTESRSIPHAPQRARPKFEARWLCEESVETIIQTAWDQAKQFHDWSLARKTEMVHNTLHSWDKTELRGPRHRLKQLQKELNAVLAGPLSEEALVQQRVVLDQIEDILEQEELYWVQRGRANWLRHGDQNTSFFHGFASQRKRKNFIKKLQRDNGVWEEDQDQLRTMASDYFSQLFTSGVYEADPYAIDKVKSRVDSTMNAALMAPYTREEVKKGLFNIGDLKAPGPDGLHAVFYKRFWHIIGEDLTDEVLAAISSKSIPEGWNDTTIVLIPKVENPETITQFRPISLCNVVYKVISKVVANRLKGLLPDIISPFQSAFVPGRLITDNFLVAYESYHTIKNKRIGKFGSCAVKLDMHKAYDRVEWCFLESIMIKLGFDPDWVELIMACVSSVRYKVRFNNGESELIIPTRGLRQGDPLSPYLFLLCAEGLTAMINAEEEEGNIIGVKVCRATPAISHLLFADDSLILMRADSRNASSLRHALDRYCQASGQLVSDAKSSIFFSPCTSVEVKEEICTTLNILTEAITDKYLGLPPIVGVDRTDCF
jgi:hypothetical protein